MHADVRFPLFATVLCSLFLSARAFYVPGVSARAYKSDEKIPLLLNKVYSDHSQLQYAFAELPFVCKPDGKRRGRYFSGESISLNLGEVLRGDRITVSDYLLEMGKDEDAKHLCTQKVDKAGLERAKQVIRDGYVAEWIVDNLPGATSFVSTDKSRKYYAAGFKMGWMEYPSDSEPPIYYINNHVTLVIRHRPAPGRAGEKGKQAIVGFEVYAKSIDADERDEDGLPPDVHHPDRPMVLSMTNATDPDAEVQEYVDIPYTYSVYFRQERNLEWANRWDMYFVNQEDSFKVHWFAIVNSVVICALLTAMVAVIFGKTIRGDLSEEGIPRAKRMTSKARSPTSKIFEKGGLLDQAEADLEADLAEDDEGLEDTAGWKLLHGDVFRSPEHGGLLAPLVGSGMQLVFMTAGLLILGCFGILNPSFRGGYISTGMALFIFAGVFSGYFSARIYKTFGGQDWKRNTIITGTLIPGLLFVLVFVLNLFVWAQSSSTAIPFTTLIALAALWLLIQLPLVYIGSWYGFDRVGHYEHPTKTTTLPRQIPQQAWYTRTPQAALVAGLLPFIVVFIELMFVFRSLWQDKSGYYYLFGFSAVVFTIMVITVIEVSIVATYILLCAENYHWWWHSFAVGASSSVWIFLYCAWYFFTKLHIEGFVSGLLFFAYSGMACAVYGLLTGTIGFLVSYAFVRRIYGAIKAD